MNAEYDVCVIDGVDHIVSLKDEFTLKVLPPDYEFPGFWENIVSYNYGVEPYNDGSLFPQAEHTLLVTGVDTDYELNNPYLDNSKQWHNAVQFYLHHTYGDIAVIKSSSPIDYEHDVIMDEDDFAEANAFYKEQAEAFLAVKAAKKNKAE
ncbi:hypothetical protein DYU05_06115 [Mucilaginibacter terrenus]|uniref:Uncharacterized protein n=1 Tax=Mucilaginibacter terrenus TaxID=2482727 RepID=A0A3E2NVY4_9SPHI|nr:hypothetical protein [Mucilaginibacter terrenus]RFZ85173.1 hypothetical protein DYU05_06115 [Mucilaginibacter terrenus]